VSIDNRSFSSLVPLVAALAVGCGRGPIAPVQQVEIGESAHRHPVIVRKPIGPPTVPTGTFDEKGRPVTIACATCHATKPSAADTKLGVQLKQFHQGLIGQHGNLSCVSCHNPADGYATLRLADGKSVPYSEVMMLCAQCHGSQFRDYQHGAHGGMTGFWDRTKGSRARNNCIDCHDAHAPKFPTVSPVSSPNDRNPSGGGHE
jgi:hypothetical protein